MPEELKSLPVKYLNADGNVDSHKVGAAWQKGEISAEQLNDAMEIAIRHWLQAITGPVKS